MEREKKLIVKALWLLHRCVLNIVLTKSEHNYSELADLADIIEALEEVSNGDSNR